MKKVLSFFALAVAAAMFAACDGGEKDPVQAAVMEKVLAENPGVVKFDFTKFERVKDVTLSDELVRRQSLFITKEKHSKVEKSRRAAAEIISRIEAYREVHAAQMDSVIYSIYTFDGFGKMEDGGKVVAEGQYATVSPEGVVLTLQPAGGNPSKGMGIAVPGYLEEIIGREAGTVEE